MTEPDRAHTQAQLSLGSLLGVSGDLAVGVTGLTSDSRKVEPGFIFFALPGSVADGRDFIGQACERGAAAIISTPDANPCHLDVPFVGVPDPRQLYAHMAARFAGKQPGYQMAVTGTNGKTSVADFTRQLWQHLGCQAASVGTLGLVSNLFERPGGLTTPDPVDLYQDLALAAERGVTHAAIEASSHGLDQKRLDGLAVSVAAFTNLTRDHLDYHGTFETYFQAKARLFLEVLDPEGVAVINTDSVYGARLCEIMTGLGRQTVTVGFGQHADLRLLDHHLDPAGQSFGVMWQGTRYDVTLPLMGAFQAENVALSAGVVISSGLDPVRVFEAIPKLTGVAGRMELCGKTASGGAVYVDYAHTPDGLETVLASARAHNPPAVAVVFGCGGDRDTGKRPLMGAIAARGADQTYVTDDNPRFEDPATIRAAILAAVPKAVEIADRQDAICTAIKSLGTDEILIIAGKGHEAGQTVAGTVHPFKDTEVARACLMEQGGFPVSPHGVVS